MLPDRVSNPGPLTYESGALPIALRGLALMEEDTGKNEDFKDQTSTPSREAGNSQSPVFTDRIHHQQNILWKQHR